MMEQENRLEEFERIEHLLYGFNYAVCLSLYGPGDPNSSIQQTLRELVSYDCEVSDTFSSTAGKAKTEIMDKILYRGDHSSGPVNLHSKEAEVVKLMESVFSRVNLQEAHMVTEFGFKRGQPHYPVFWDFAYDIHTRDARWIFIGSSSD